LTWITGQDAEIELPSPGVNTELQLIMEATPFLGDGVPQRTINVQANGTPVGTLGLADPEVQFCSLTIKATVNSAPILKLHFSFSPVPNNPNPVDSQPRQIGLARLALVPLGHPVEQPAGTTDTTALTRQNP
jgi:hypothetical protein